MNTCRVCGETKAVELFVKDRNTCKGCQVTKNKAYYEANREAILSQKVEYTASISESRKQQYAESTGDYYREKNRQWYKANSDKNRFRSHRRRFSEFSVEKFDFPVDILSRLVEFYGTNCLNPECKTPDAKATLDHVVPINKGGVHGLENFQVLCLPCNSSKRDRHATDYRNGRFYVWEEANA